MRTHAPLCTVFSLAAAVVSCACFGCGPGMELRRQPMAPLGSINDSIWQKQEHHAEAADFYVYAHEFKLNQARLNMAGEDHLKQIATRLRGEDPRFQGQDFQVVIERSMTTPREHTKHKLPIHPNPELDMQRREVVVRALTTLGVVDAEERVVVAPSFTTGYTAAEAASTYLQGAGAGGGGGGGGWGGGWGGIF